MNLKPFRHSAQANRDSGSTSRQFRLDHDRSYLVKWIALPLIVAAVIFIWLAYFLGAGVWADLCVNLGATCIGALVTVCYVDHVIKRLEDRRQEKAHHCSRDRVRNLALTIYDRYRTVFAEVWSEDVHIPNRAVLDQDIESGSSRYAVLALRSMAAQAVSPLQKVSAH